MPEGKIVIDSIDKYKRALEALDNTQLAAYDRPMYDEIAAAARDYSHQMKVKDFTAKVDNSVDMRPEEKEESVFDRMRGPSARAGALRHSQGRSAYENERVELEKLAARSAVDFTTGMDWKKRGKAGLMDYAPEIKRAILEDFARKEIMEAGLEIPNGVPVMEQLGDTGELMYLKPFTDEKGNVKLRRTLINPTGLDKGDAARIGTEVAAVAPEIAAEGMAFAGGTFASGGNPAVGVAAGAAAAGASNVAINRSRRAIAESLGVPEDILDETSRWDYVDDAVVATVGSAALPFLSGSARKVANMGRVETNLSEQVGGGVKKGWWDEPRKGKYKHAVGDQQKAIDVARENIEKNAAKIEKANEMGNVKLQASVAELTEDPVMLVAEREVRQRTVGKASKELAERDVRNTMASMQAVRNMADGVVPDNPNLMSADMAAQKAQEKIKQPLLDKEGKLTAKEDGLEELMAKTDDLPKRGVYDGMQKDLDELGQKARENEATAWDAYREIGEDKAVINPQGSPIRNMLEELEDGGQQLSRDLSKVNESLLKDLGADPVEQGKRAKQIGEGLTAQSLHPDQLHKLMSHLKSVVRHEESNMKSLGWKKKDVNKVIDAIQTQMDTLPLRDMTNGRMLGKAEAMNLRNAWSLANETTVQRIKTFDNKAMRKILQPDDSGRRLMEGSMSKFLFQPGDASNVAKALSAGDYSPAMRETMGRELESLYKRTVFKDGQIQPGAHKAFMANFRDHSDEIFGEEGSAMINNAFGLSEQIKKLQKKNKKYQKKMEHMYGRKLTQEETYAGNVARDMLNGEVPVKQIKNTKQVLGADSREWKSIQRTGLNAITDDLSSKAGNVGNADALNKLVAEHKPRLEELYDKPYADGMEALGTALSAVARGDLAGTSRKNLMPIWLQWTRTIWGALSTAQRRISALQRSTNKVIDLRLRRVAGNPEVVKNLHRLYKLDPLSAEKTAYLMASGKAIPHAAQMGEALQAEWDANAAAIESLLYVPMSPEVEEVFAAPEWDGVTTEQAMDQHPDYSREENREGLKGKGASYGSGNVKPNTTIKTYTP